MNAFRAAILVLFVTAAWDWWRFQDRSRTFYATLALGIAFPVAGLIALAWSQPPTGPALHELAGVGLMFALALAFVQLYRTSETVLTIARGTLYMLALVIAEALWEIATGHRLTPVDLPAPAAGEVAIAGPFGSVEMLAAACCVALLVMPVGFSLEHDPRLRWAYVAVAFPVPFVVLHTGSILGVVVCLATLVVWSLQHRATRFLGIPLIVVWLLLVPGGRTFLGTLWDLVEDPWLAHERISLLLNGVVMLRRSVWLGVGPAGFPYVLETQWLPFPTYDGVSSPRSALVEISSQYGLSLFVAATLAVIGLLRWCMQRLLSTRGLPLSSPERVVAFWLLVTLVLLPITSAMPWTWLVQPIAALQLGTIVLMARHIERPKGRLVMPSETALRHIPPGPASAAWPSSASASGASPSSASPSVGGSR